VEAFKKIGLDLTLKDFNPEYYDESDVEELINIIDECYKMVSNSCVLNSILNSGDTTYVDVEDGYTGLFDALTEVRSICESYQGAYRRYEDFHDDYYGEQKGTRETFYIEDENGILHFFEE